MSREQNELIGEFKMVVADVISRGGYIPRRIKKELVRFGVVCDWKG